MPGAVAWVRWQGPQTMQLPLEDKHDRNVLKRKLWFYIKINADIFLLRMQMYAFFNKKKKGNKGQCQKNCSSSFFYCLEYLGRESAGRSDTLKAGPQLLFGSPKKIK